MGLLGEIFDDVGSEMSRLGTQGSMELASALFNDNAFVPYGPGQYTPSPEQEQAIQGPTTTFPEQEFGGMEM